MTNHVHQIYTVIHSVSNSQPVRIALNRNRLEQEITLQERRPPVPYAQIIPCSAVEGNVPLGRVGNSEEIPGNYFSVSHNNRRQGSVVISGDILPVQARGTEGVHVAVRVEDSECAVAHRYGDDWRVYVDFPHAASASEKVAAMLADIYLVAELVGNAYSVAESLDFAQALDAEGTCIARIPF